MQSTSDEATKLPAQVEDKLRLRAFHLFYNKILADERDLALRFAQAIVASAGPIDDADAVAEWRRDYARWRRR